MVSKHVYHVILGNCMGSLITESRSYLRQGAVQLLEPPHSCRHRAAVALSATAEQQPTSTMAVGWLDVRVACLRRERIAPGTREKQLMRKPGLLTACAHSKSQGSIYYTMTDGGAAAGLAMASSAVVLSGGAAAAAALAFAFSSDFVPAWLLQLQAGAAGSRSTNYYYYLSQLEWW
jgi:hypothetical protein